MRTQQVIAHETGVTHTTDPLGGSWFVEDLTNRLEAEAYDYFARIEKIGGVIPAIKENFFQREIAEASFRYQSEVEAEQRVIVGVNRYEIEGDQPLHILRIDPELEQQQVGARAGGPRTARLGRRRGPPRRLKQAAAGERNLMEPIVDAAKAYVTMGEMCDAFRDVWGCGGRRPSSNFRATLPVEQGNAVVVRLQAQLPEDTALAAVDLGCGPGRGRRGGPDRVSPGTRARRSRRSSRTSPCRRCRRRPST